MPGIIELRTLNRLALVAIASFCTVAGAGDLNPPAGPVGPTMKT